MGHCCCRAAKSGAGEKLLETAKRIVSVKTVAVDEGSLSA
ncbi:MAG: hypothetical protein C207_05182 [Bradyrhizobium sp. DFCI-1]|jgi:hypothetical protein|nr:MAG: hypothetical protein C207_05182 [Bradyrhizobium sp. DFCI-1]